MSSSRHSQSRIFWGLFLIALGALFLLDRLGRIDFGYMVSRYWPVIFIIVGLSILIGSQFRSAGPGFFFIIFGAFFLLMRLRIFDRTIWHYFWPLLIIFIGLWILLKPVFGEGKKKLAEIKENELDATAIFSGWKRQVESQNFKGGKVTAVFGGAELDLTQAKLAAEKPILEATAVFGSVEIRLPGEWQAVIHGTPVLGSIEDKRKIAAASEPRPTLYIEASAVFGSIEIKG